jgi:3-hydroxyacyl-CoA dehydrogenase
VIESSAVSPAIIEEMVERGELGVKSGKGFYDWDDEAVSALRQRVGTALAAIDRLSGEG